MSIDESIITLRDAIVALDEDLAEKTTEELIAMDFDINEIIGKGITEAARIIGEKFESMEYFLGELLIAEEIITNSLNRFISVLPAGDRVEKKGTVIIATVYGDIHDIGKNLLSQMLKIRLRGPRPREQRPQHPGREQGDGDRRRHHRPRSEEHTSELQSR